MTYVFSGDLAVTTCGIRDGVQQWRASDNDGHEAYFTAERTIGVDELLALATAALDT